MIVRYLAPLSQLAVPLSLDSLDHLLIAGWHEGPLHPDVVDAIAPWWRDKSTWLVCYAILVAWMLWRYRWSSLLHAVLAGLSVGLADYCSAGVIKPLIARLRPCRTVGLVEHLDVLVNCGSGFSFPSAHAANHFALATFLAVTVFVPYPIWRIAVVSWAASIALAQVYVGVHYPSDVLAGAVLGTLIGLVGARISNVLVHRYGLSPKQRL